MPTRRFTRAELLAYHGGTVDDVLPPGLRLLVVGINPGLWTAAVNAHFARPGGRFWPALHRAGITQQRLDVSAGMTAQALAELAAAGVGITNLVPVATARADEVTKEQLAGARERLAELVRRHRPRVVAVLGKTAYGQAFGRRRGSAGRQPEPFEGAELWVLPNPSGLNAHDTVDSARRGLPDRRGGSRCPAALRSSSAEPGASRRCPAGCRVLEGYPVDEPERSHDDARSCGAGR